jgi:hypothetical protein
MKLVSALLLTLLYVALLLAFYVIHVWYFPVEVVLYSAVVDAALAAAASVVVLVLIGRRVPLGGFERVLLVVIWLLGGYAFAISAPTVLDRSLSFYILEKLAERGGGIKEASFPDVFIHEYMDEFRLVDVRLTEQLQSGTIAIANGCVTLTPRGKLIAGISSFLRQNFLPRHRLLAGQYTDALVDPFAHGTPGKLGYECP